MPDNTADYKDVLAIVVKVTRPDADDKTKVTLKSLATGTWVSATIWDNSHPGCVTNPPKKGDLMLASGKIKQNKGDDGTVYNNLSVYSYAVSPCILPVPKDESEGGNAPVEAGNLPDVI